MDVILERIAACVLQRVAPDIPLRTRVLFYVRSTTCPKNTLEMRGEAIVPVPFGGFLMGRSSVTVLLFQNFRIYDCQQKVYFFFFF
jgi:hypothetical protein